MSRGIFAWNRQDSAGRPLSSGGEQDLLRTRRQALRDLPGVTFVFAALYLVMALATVVKGDFRIPWMLNALPALAAACLAIRGRGARSVTVCAAGPGVLFAWGALAALVTRALG